MGIYKKIDKLHLELGCNIQKFEGGAGFPLDYSDRLSEEINLLLKSSGLFDLKACWLISLFGSEAGKFLQGMVTSDVLNLKIGQIQSSLICDNKGKILHHIKIFRIDEKEWIVICDPGNGRSVATILDNFHIREDLEMKLLNKEKFLRVDLIGPESTKILTKIGFIKKNHQWTFYDGIIYSIQFDLGKVTRLINLVEFKVFKTFVEKIFNMDNVNFISQKSFDEIRIMEGLPRFGIDYNVGNLPQESGLSDHISFEKGCYIGQETHARMFTRGHANWILVWLSIPKIMKVKVGDILFCNTKEVGRITSVGSFEEKGFFKGIGMIKYEFADEGINLSLKEEILPQIKQKSLPFRIK